MVFRFQSFANFPIRHGMSQRRFDSPSEGDIAYARDTIERHISSNRSAFLREAGFDLPALTLGRQIHGNGVRVVTSEDRGRGQPPTFDAIPNADGLVTKDADVALGTIVADCVPILLYDPVQRAIGVVHAGWRGTVGRIGEVAVTVMDEAFSSRPSDLWAGIGPSIGPCCYEVGDEVVDEWLASGIADAKRAIVSRSPRSHLDLWTANRMTLERAGIQTHQIEAPGICTRCDRRYFSHRAWTAGERPRGRMIMVAQLTT